MFEIQKHQELFLEYQDAIIGNTERSVKWLKEVTSYFIKQTGVKIAEEITVDCIERWLIEGKRDRKWSDKTRRTRIQAMRSFCRWLVKKKHLDQNSAEKIPLPKAGKTLPDFLSEEKSEELLQFTKFYPFTSDYEKLRAYAIIAVFLFTGIRRQELIDLKMQNVDIKNSLLQVKCGKGKKDRNIPFCSRLAGILETYLVEKKKLNRLCPYFFTSLSQDARMGDKVIPRLVKKLHESSGIQCNPHLLRHTFAVLMIQGGCDIYHLAQLMGHSDIGTTAIYLTAAVEHLKKVSGKHPLSGLQFD